MIDIDYQLLYQAEQKGFALGFMACLQLLEGQIRGLEDKADDPKVKALLDDLKRVDIIAYEKLEAFLSDRIIPHYALVCKKLTVIEEA